MSRVKAGVYESLQVMLEKTDAAYPSVLSESFVNATFSDSRDELVGMAGMHLLLSHMSGEDALLRDCALKLTAAMMSANASICV